MFEKCKIVIHKAECKHCGKEQTPFPYDIQRRINLIISCEHCGKQNYVFVQPVLKKKRSN